MQWLPEEIDARMVQALIGVDGGHEGPRTVPDEEAVAFLQLVGLLPSSRRARFYTWPRIWRLRRSRGTGRPGWLNIRSRVKLPDALEAEVSCRSAGLCARS